MEVGVKISIAPVVSRRVVLPAHFVNVRKLYIFFTTKKNCLLLIHHNNSINFFFLFRRKEDKSFHSLF